MLIFCWYHMLIGTKFCSYFNSFLCLLQLRFAVFHMIFNRLSVGDLSKYWIKYMIITTMICIKYSDFSTFLHIGFVQIYMIFPVFMDWRNVVITCIFIDYRYKEKQNFGWILLFLSFNFWDFENDISGKTQIVNLQW